MLAPLEIDTRVTSLLEAGHTPEQAVGQALREVGYSFAQMTQGESSDLYCVAGEQGQLVLRITGTKAVVISPH